jgi:hypothetical protein
MNHELETYKQRLTLWIENGYKPEEPTIKVSELREWIEQEIKFINENYLQEDKFREIGMLIEMKHKFCKEAK